MAHTCTIELPRGKIVDLITIELPPISSFQALALAEGAALGWTAADYERRAREVEGARAEGRPPEDVTPSAPVDRVALGLVYAAALAAAPSTGWVHGGGPPATLRDVRHDVLALGEIVAEWAWGLGYPADALAAGGRRVLEWASEVRTAQRAEVARRAEGFDRAPGATSPGAR